MILIDNINEFVGSIPTGHEMIVFEKGDTSTAMSLFGFDEVGQFDHLYDNPQYGFISFLEVV